MNFCAGGMRCTNVTGTNLETTVHPYSIWRTGLNLPALAHRMQRLYSFPRPRFFQLQPSHPPPKPNAPPSNALHLTIGPSPSENEAFLCTWARCPRPPPAPPNETSAVHNREQRNFILQPKSGFPKSPRHVRPIISPKHCAKPATLKHLHLMYVFTRLRTPIKFSNGLGIIPDFSLICASRPNYIFLYLLRPSCKTKRLNCHSPWCRVTQSDAPCHEPLVTLTLRPRRTTKCTSGTDCLSSLLL